MEIRIRIKIESENDTDFNEKELALDLNRKFEEITGYKIIDLDIYEL
jgi:hypothetical protein